MAAQGLVAQLLKDAGVVDEAQLRAALSRQHHRGGRLTRIVTELGFATDDEVVTALSRGLHLDVVQLDRPDADALAKVDGRLAAERGVFPVRLVERSGKTLVLAMADPTDVAAVDEISRLARVRVQPAVAAEGAIAAAVRRHYGLDPGADRASPDRRAAPSRALTLEEEIGGVPELELEREHSPPPTPALPHDFLPRVQAAQVNQTKVKLILRALEDLLREKQLLD